MHHISDWLTHIDNEADKPYLRSKLLNVNIRLMRANEKYWALVKAACDHIEEHCLTELEGYKLPHGTSGANLGIPWNIIGIAINRGTEDAKCRVMINPLVTGQFGEPVETTTNCGSIRLDKPIKIKRWPHISVKYYNLDGNVCYSEHWPETHSFTIQHEVDHNLGVLITDYK